VDTRLEPLSPSVPFETLIEASGPRKGIPVREVGCYEICGLDGFRETRRLAVFQFLPGGEPPTTWLIIPRMF
jgi:hypothetical protein